MSERPADLPPAKPPRPRPSACGVLVRRGADGRRLVLLGRRSRTSRFMPGHLAFPGGGLEPVDGTTDDDAAWARCASRELLEETALEIEPSAWIDAGRRITPPIFPVRFDTWFFVAEADEHVRPDASVSGGEIESLEFEAPAAIVEAWEQGREALPPPVLPLLRVLATLDGESDLSRVASRLEQANALEQRAPRIEFVPGVWMLPLQTATMPPASHTNCWMPGGTSFVIIDPAAVDEVSRDRLHAVIARRRETGAEPIAVLLTHGHRDHRDGATRIARELGIPMRAHGDVLGGLAPDEHGVPIEPIADGTRFDLGGTELVAIHTPGHAPGHLAYHLPESRALIAGDLVSGLSTILIPPDHGDMASYLASLRRAIALEVRTLLPGHGPPLPAKALSSALRHRAMREGRIVRALGAGSRSLSELSDTAYAATPGLPPVLIRAQTAAHLLTLERAGRVRRDDRDGEQWSAIGEDTLGRLRACLESAFAPERLEIVDDSASHAGHVGAASGGGHFVVTLVARAFEGRSRLEQHRMVYAAVGEMVGREIHALALTTAAPSESAPG